MTLIEAKVADTSRSRSLYYFQNKFPEAKCVQVVMKLDKNSTKDQILLTPASLWLAQPLKEQIF